MRVVEAIVMSGKPIGPRGLARTTGIDRSAVSRILTNLSDQGYLENLGGNYAPGLRLQEISRILHARDTFLDAATDVLDRVASRFDETCYLASFHNCIAKYILEIPSSKPLRFAHELGVPIALHAGASGRAILAGLSDEAIYTCLKNIQLPALGPNTITNADQVVRRAHDDRLRGFSVSIEERTSGGAAVGAPYFDTKMCRGSIVFTAPTSRFTDLSVEEVGKEIFSAARTISKVLGGAENGFWEMATDLELG